MKLDYATIEACAKKAQSYLEATTETKRFGIEVADAIRALGVPAAPVGSQQDGANLRAIPRGSFLRARRQ